jgi:hypothetical protein
VNIEPKLIIEILTSEYEALLKRVNWLDALEEAGVDNWSGMDEAVRIFRGDKEDDESYEDIYGEED